MPLNHNQQKQFNMVCARIAGGESLRKACKDKDLPTPQGVIKWLHSGKYPDAVEQYARARQDQADFYADEMVDIADDESLDPNSRRIMIDARKWIAAKLKPKVYGDKLALGGADDLPAIKQEVRERADAFVASIEAMADKAGKGETRH